MFAAYSDNDHQAEVLFEMYDKICQIYIAI